MPQVDGTDELGNVGFSGNTDATNDPLNMGFGAAWRRFLLTGLYNSDFGLTPLDIGQAIDNVNNPLPFWSLVNISGDAFTVFVVPDASAASGYVLDFEMGTGAAGDQVMLQQFIPIQGNRARSWVSALMHTSLTPADYVSQTIDPATTIDFYLADGVTTTGSAYSAFGSRGSAGIALSSVSSPQLVPSDAYWVRIGIGVRRGAVAAATDVSHLQITDIAWLNAPPFLGLAALTVLGGATSAVGVLAADETSPGINTTGTDYAESTTFTISGGGTATFSNKVCRWSHVGRLIAWRLTFNVTANGSGGTAITIANVGWPIPAVTSVINGDRSGVGLLFLAARMSGSSGDIAEVRSMDTATQLIGTSLLNGAGYSFSGAYYAD